MKNKLTDLNDHLFAQLERLTEEGISEDSLKVELRRSKEVAQLAAQTINNARLILDANVYASNSILTNGIDKNEGTKLLGISGKEK